jgi:hypothetical protein
MSKENWRHVLIGRPIQLPSVSRHEDCMKSIMAKTLGKLTPGIPDGCSRIKLDRSLERIPGIDGSS